MTFEELLQRKMDDGLRQGIQEGLQRGIAKGISRAEVADILNMNE